MAEDGFSAIWEGIRGFGEAMDRIAEQAAEASKEIVARSAAVVEAAAKANFEGAHKKGQPHVGGDRPNVVTGTLRRSIRSTPIVQVGRGAYSTTVGPSTVYARRVELGYRGSRAYPYFSPAARKVQPQLEAIAAETWRKFLTH